MFPQFADVSLNADQTVAGAVFFAFGVRQRGHPPVMHGDVSAEKEAGFLPPPSHEG